MVIGVGVGSKVKAGKKGADGDLIANTDLTTWLAPISTPAEIRQYCEKLYDTVAALPFATVVPAPISGDDGDDSEIFSDDSDDEPPNLDSLAIA
jgi:hypothetical protein